MGNWLHFSGGEIADNEKDVAVIRLFRNCLRVMLVNCDMVT